MGMKGSLLGLQPEDDLTKAEKQEPAGGGELIPIGQEMSEQYEWEPSCL